MKNPKTISIRVKKNVSEKSASIKKFCVKHKKEIIVTTAIAGVIIVGGVLVHKNIGMKKTIQAAGETIADQNAKISQLNNQLNSAQKGIVNQSARIHQLKDLCDEKDRIHLNRISDGVRHGISVCAQDLVDWREYMKHSAAAC